MKVFIAGNYAELSAKAADDLIQLMKTNDHPVACTASGDSPAGMYKLLVEKFERKELDVSNWQILGLDEWVGLNGDTEGSCRYHLNNQLFNPLQLTSEQIVFFDGKAADLQQECEAVETFIQQHGGIDVAILGLGLNGHIGMNEPGTSAVSRSHVITLDPITQKTGQKYFKERQELTHGITLGIASLMDAKQIMLLVSGAKKAAIVKQLLEEEISEKIPGTLLRNHPGLTVYLDKEAASLLAN